MDIAVELDDVLILRETIAGKRRTSGVECQNASGCTPGTVIDPDFRLSSISRGFRM